MTPPHTHRFGYANLTSKNSDSTYRHNLTAHKRTIDRMVDPYIVLWPLETSSPEYTRANTLMLHQQIFENQQETVDVLDLNNVNNTQIQ